MKDGKVDFFGKEQAISDLKDRMSDLSVMAGARPCTFAEGPEKGVLAVDVWTASGLRYTVLPDRGMNICGLRYRGVPLDWPSGTGPTAPSAYDGREWHWLRSFNGGLLHTCGLDNVGEPCVDDEKSFGGHGRISNTPARGVSWGVDEARSTIEVKGTCRQAAAIEENLELARSVTSDVDGKRIILRDTVTNRGFARAPVFLLYHCNFGFPLLSERSKLKIPAKEAVDAAGNKVGDLSRIDAPCDSGDEQVLHPVIDDDRVEVSLFNAELGENGLGVYLKYRKSELPHLTVWKFFQRRSYVMGIEPGTCRVGGRDVEKAENRVVFLNADESFTVSVEIGVID